MHKSTSNARSASRALFRTSGTSYRAKMRREIGAYGTMGQLGRHSRELWSHLRHHESAEAKSQAIRMEDATRAKSVCRCLGASSRLWATSTQTTSPRPPS